MNDVIVREEETLDDLLKGKLKIIQNKKGYRFSIDAILLANFVKNLNGERIIDLGTGSAVIPLILAKRFPHIKVIGVEIQDSLVDIARRNVIMNNFSDQISINHTDLRDLATSYPAGHFGIVLSNPPYRPLHSGQINALTEKAIARHEIKSSIEEIATIARYLLKKGGRFFCVYPAARMPDLIFLLRKNKIEPKKLKFVYSHEHESAKLILLEGMRGSKTGIDIQPPLYLFDHAGHYTAEADKIYEIGA